MVFLLFYNFENLERACVSLLMLSAKQGNHWYHFFKLETSTIPLGYRGGVGLYVILQQFVNYTSVHQLNHPLVLDSTDLFFSDNRYQETIYQ